MPSFILKKYWGILIIIALFFLQFLFISPIGEFALNDDWVHTDSIKHFLETSKLRLLPWAGPTFYFPIFLGVIFSKIFGFSYTLLRIITLLSTLFLILLSFSYSRKFSKNIFIPIITVLIIWLNPIVYNLSFTFMTDILALLLLFISFLFYTKGIKNNSWKFLLLGSLISIIGFYTRQTNILMFVAASILIIHQDKQLFTKKIILGFFIPGLFLLGSYIGIGSLGLLPESLGITHVPKFSQELFTQIIKNLWQYALILGLLTSPLSLSWAYKKINSIHKNNFIFLSIFLVISFLLNLHWQDRLWHVGNIINAFGLGPTQVINGTLTPLISQKIQIIFTLFSATSFYFFFLLLKNKKIQILQKITGKLTLTFCLLYGLVIIFVLGFDRYILPIFLFLILISTKHLKNKEISKPITITLLIIITIFSISQTKHYLTWNNIRWELAQTVSAPPNHIDAGYEWNGIHSYWSAQSSKKISPNTSPWWIRNMFTNNTEEYIVSFSSIPNFKIIKKINLNTWNPNNTLYLLHQEP